MMGYRYKRSPAGSIIEIKARRSMSGDLMRPHEHYNPEHMPAPLAKNTTIRRLLAIKAAHGLISEYLYITPAYVHET